MANQLELKELLQSGAHFGHQTHKWNPKMKPYVYGERNGIYVIDLMKTIPLAKQAYEFLKKTANEGKPILFVGTKRQAAEVVKNAAKDSGAFYVTHRWLGGMLTNYKTIALSIDKLRKVEKMKETGDFDLLPKKERSKIDKDISKLERNLGGIKEMKKLPGAIFVIDPESEKTAVLEARKMGIPVVAIADTNANPDMIDFIVPGNDDAIKSITLFTNYFASSVAEGSNRSKTGAEEDVDVDSSLEKEIISKYEQDIDLKLGDEEE